LISQHLSNLGAGSWQIDMHEPKLSDFLLDLHQSLAHQGLAKSLDISIGMPALFANLADIHWYACAFRKPCCIKILAHFFAKNRST